LHPEIEFEFVRCSSHPFFRKHGGAQPRIDRAGIRSRLKMKRSRMATFGSSEIWPLPDNTGIGLSGSFRHFTENHTEEDIENKHESQLKNGRDPNRSV